MFAGAEGVYEYGLLAVCPLMTPGVGVGKDIVNLKRTDFGTIAIQTELKSIRVRVVVYIKTLEIFVFLWPNLKIA